MSGKITMCRGVGCPRKRECYRHRAVPDPHNQSWWAESPWKEGTCGKYLPIYPSDVLAGDR
jgi:hypothetical protein